MIAWSVGERRRERERESKANHRNKLRLIDPTSPTNQLEVSVP